MIKILYMINFLTNSGPTRVLQNILKNLDKSKYKITVLTLIDENDKDIVNKLRNDGIDVIELKYEKSLNSILKNRKKIISQIEKCAPNIIHTHGIVSTMIVQTKSIKSKKVTTIHNNIFEDYKCTYGRLKGVIFAYLHILALKRFDEVICCSKTSYDIMKKYIHKATFVRNGIDIEEKSNRKEIRNKIREDLKINKDAIIYTYGGNINSVKRVVKLIDMFKNALEENEYLLIVGDGPLMEKAKKCAKENSNIIFTGFKTNIIDYFLASDVYVSYSSSEGFSISIIEALSCGLNLLLSDIPSHKECFEIDSNYYLGEYYNSKNFVEKKKNLKYNIKNKNNKDEIIKFQDTYLSSVVMTDGYIKYY